MIQIQFKLNLSSLKKAGKSANKINFKNMQKYTIVIFQKGKNLEK